MNVNATLNYHSVTRYPTDSPVGRDVVEVEVMLITLSDLPSPHNWPIRLLQTKVVDNYKTVEQSIKTLTGAMRDDMHEVLMIETYLIDTYINPKMPKPDCITLSDPGDEYVPFSALGEDEDEFPW